MSLSVRWINDPWRKVHLHSSKGTPAFTGVQIDLDFAEYRSDTERWFQHPSNYVLVAHEMPKVFFDGIDKDTGEEYTGCYRFHRFILQHKQLSKPGKLVQTIRKGAETWTWTTSNGVKTSWSKRQFHEIAAERFGYEVFQAICQKVY